MSPNRISSLFYSRNEGLAWPYPGFAARRRGASSDDAAHVQGVTRGRQVDIVVRAPALRAVAVQRGVAAVSAHCVVAQVAVETKASKV